MEMIPVDSAKIESFGYDAATKTLVMEMKGNGARYQYDDVPPEEVQGFQSSSSKGLYHHQRFFKKYNEHRI